MAESAWCLLLLPSALDEFAHADEVRDLLRAPAVVAVEPARVGARGELLAEVLAATQARRLRRKLRADPRVVVVYAPAQYPLARALLARAKEGELWYLPPGEVDDRDVVIHDLAVQRASLVLEPSGETVAFRRNAPLWDRLEELGLARR